MNVRLVMEGMKIGGGHDCAAGGRFKPETGSVEPADCILQVKKWLEENTPILG